jgi:uncharacterized repeat protein (TIGR03803 family)
MRWRGNQVDTKGRTFALAMVAGLICGPAVAWTYTTLHNFTGGADGSNPWSNLASDSSGNLYGTNQAGADFCSDDVYDGCGVVYKLDSVGALTTLHTFTGGSGGGDLTTGVTLAAGRIFGGANGGTTSNGMLYSMKLDGSAFTALHQFDGTDGDVPEGLLQRTTNGFIGITYNGGAGYRNGEGTGDGVLFFVSPEGQYKVLHRFEGNSDGRNPTDIVTDSAGNVFGSTYGGGGACPKAETCGTIFEYNPTSQAYSVIYRFTRQSDGYEPILGGVDSSGALYGAAYGGDSKHGTLFKLAPAAGGYSFILLASLKSHGPFDQPNNPPALGKDGALVGAMTYSLYIYHAGTVSYSKDGSSTLPNIDPLGQILIGRDSTIYGTSVNGAITPCVYSNGQQDANGCGSLFSYTLR